MITPFKVPSLLQSLYPGLVWKHTDAGDSVYLTFDDGPHPRVTPWVLDLLGEYNAKATFFCVGENALRYPGVLKSITERGHSIGNHTHNHLKGWNTKTSAYIENTRLASLATSSRLFRPPYGRITRAQIGLLKAAGYKIIMWNQLSCDYLRQLDRQKSLQSLLDNARPGNIVVFHDSDKAFANLEWILPRYLQAMKDKQFNFLPL